MARPVSASVRVATALTCVVFAVVWIFWASPGVHWLDTTELALAAASLGIGHPPGQVIHAQLGHLATLIPFGDVAFRVTCLSIFSLVFAVGLLITLVDRLRGKGFDWSLALWIPPLLAPMMTTQAVRCEVYALAFFLLVAAVWLGTLPGRNRQAAGWFIWGLAAVVHPVIAAAGLPLLVRRSSIGSALWAGWAACSLAYLPVRAWANAAWNFGDPRTLERFSWFVRGKLYKAYDRPSLGQAWEHVIDIGILLGRNVSLLMLILAVVAIWLFRNRPASILRTVLSAFLSILPLAAMGNFYAENPDAWGYLLPLLGGTVFLAAITAETWVQTAPAKWKIGFCLFVGVGLMTWQITQPAQRDLSNDYSARTHMQSLWEEPTPKSSVVTASFSTFSLMSYAQIVEGRRSDVVLGYRGLPNTLPGSGTYIVDQNVWWELGLKSTANAKYSLRSEDFDMANQLFSWGWFCRGNLPPPSAWTQRYRQDLAAALNEMPGSTTYAREPLILNVVLHALLAEKHGNQTEADELRQVSNDLFPSFSDWALLEVRP